MIRRHLRVALVASTVLAVGAPALSSQASAAAGTTSPAGCSSGAHSLAPVGSHLYPDTGNGGYTSATPSADRTTTSYRLHARRN